MSAHVAIFDKDNFKNIFPSEIASHKKGWIRNTCRSETLLIITEKDKEIPPPYNDSNIKPPVGEGLVAELAVHGLLAGVELLDVEPEVRLPATGGGTQLAVVHRLVPGICTTGPIHQFTQQTMTCLFGPIYRTMLIGQTVSKSSSGKRFQALSKIRSQTFKRSYQKHYFTQTSIFL